MRWLVFLLFFLTIFHLFDFRYCEFPQIFGFGFNFCCHLLGVFFELSARYFFLDFCDCFTTHLLSLRAKPKSSLFCVLKHLLWAHFNKWNFFLDNLLAFSFCWRLWSLSTVGFLYKLNWINMLLKFCSIGQLWSLICSYSWHYRVHNEPRIL